MGCLTVLHGMTAAAAYSLIGLLNESAAIVNGFALWAVWTVGGKGISSGPVQLPSLAQRVDWDPHSRQAVKILQRAFSVNSLDSWSYQVACDLDKGQFNVKLDLHKAE